MADTATEAAKEALLPSTTTMRHLFSAGASVFGGLALTGYVGMKVGPRVQSMLGGKAIPVVSGATIARAATFAVVAFAWGMTRDTGFGKAAFAGIEVRQLLFAASAGAFATTVGSLLLDVLNKWGGSSKAATKAGSFLAMMTGIGGGQASAEAAAPAAA